MTEDEAEALVDGAMRERPKLSPRQLQVLEGIAADRSSAEIAQELGCTTRTVQTHRSNILRIMRVHSAAGAVALGFRWGWLK